VLNAFRHQRSLHTQLAATGTVASGCSTPFGIRGLCTRDRGACRHPRVQVLNAFRHQRSLHAEGFRPATAEEMCSTPFGIRGLCTWMLAGVLRPIHRVLNAFRHQRSLHVRAAVELRPHRSAQRLSASEVSARASRRHLTGCGPCAQRLSASEVSARDSSPQAPTPPRVLNAFRHQRSLHNQ